MASIAHNPADGVGLSYDVVGDGEPILLVHGSALSRAIWRGFGYTKALRENYQVITMDLRGHGRSDKPATVQAYEMATLVADVHAVLDAVGTGPVHFGGYSVGARLGFSLAVTDPGRLRSFTSLGGTYKIQPGSISSLFFDGYDAALGSGGMPAFVDGWERRIGHPLDAMTRAAFLANDAPALQAYFRQTEVDAPVPEERLAGIRVPTLLMAGTRDPQRLEDSARAAQLIPGSRLVELPGRDHGTTLIPAQPVLDEWLPFLAAHG